MPTYSYECRSCGTTKDIVRGIKEDEVKPKCENCFELGNPEMQRVITPTTFILKGGCWAKDGYKK